MLDKRSRRLWSEHADARRQLAIGLGAIAVPTALLYALVLLWPQDPPKARLIRLVPTAADDEASPPHFRGDSLYSI